MMRSIPFQTIRPLVCSIFLISIPSPAAANWPAWRGPAGDGISPEKNLPLRWSPEENAHWRVPLPEPGNSTPIVWEGKIFLTQNIGRERSLLCFDLRDGKELWRRGVEVTIEERTHPTNPYASASPVTDGERVIAWFGSGGLMAFDLEGNELWRKDLGEHSHQFGYGGSPVIFEDYCFLNFGPGPREFIVALDKQRGNELWRVESPTPGQDDIYGMWSTPFVALWQGGAELIAPLRNYLAAFDPASGKELWRCQGVGLQAKASPVAGQGVVVLSGDLQSAEVAVRLGGRGDVTETHRLWRRFPPKRRIGAGVIRDGYIYGAQINGMMDCVRLETGEIVWEERQIGPTATNASWASPVWADGLLYLLNQAGDTFIVKASPEYEQLAINSLGEPTNASIVIADGQILIRTHQALWSIKSKEDHEGQTK